MAISSGDAVKFVFIQGDQLPQEVDDSTIYIVGGTQELYVGDLKIAARIDVDAALDAESFNPVENQAIAKELNKLATTESPEFTGTPTAPTAASGTSTTQVATTEFVQNAVTAATIVVDDALNATSTNPVQNKVIKEVLDAVASLDSPAFSGTPTAPTAPKGTDTNQVATTEFVQNELEDYLKDIDTASVAYGVCSTAADTAAKVVTISGDNTGWVLEPGSIISVKFTNAVGTDSTLNVNSTGANNITYHGSSVAADIILSGDTVTLVYDGSTYSIITIDRWGSNASTAASGLMSSNDKSKLDNIPADANNYVHPTYTAQTGQPTQNQTPAFGGTATVSQIVSDGTGHITGATNRTIKIPNTEASDSASGLMSKTDKAKLDAIEDGATKVEVDSEISATSTNPVQNKVVKQAIDDAIAATDAMVFKGTLGTDGSITALPTTYHTGWTYRVVTAGTYAGQTCEIGDLLIAMVSRSGSGNLDTDWTVAQTNINGAITAITGTSPITVSGSGSSRTIAHKAYTARTGKPTANATPGFGDTVTVSQITSDASGHVTAASDRTITIPSTEASTTAAGLMSPEDKSKLDGVATGANKYTHPSYTARTGVPTANQTPAFGGTFTVNQVNSDATGHVTASTSRTITIPGNEATTSAKGLMSSADKTKLNAIGDAANLPVPIPIASGGTSATTKLDAANSLEVISLSQGTEIPVNTDLNTISTVGNYYCSTTANTGTLTNCPSARAFKMEVGRSTNNGSDTGYLYQKITRFDTGVIYYRYNDSGSFSVSKWSAWKDFSAFLPITGGTIYNDTSPVIINRHDGVDCLLTDNGVTGVQYPTTGRFHDKNNACYAGSEARVRPTGEVQMDLISRNYIVDSSKWSGYTKFGVGVNKEGKPFYEVTSPVELRNQLGIAYGTCDTAADTAAKVVSCQYLSYKLTVGSYVAVKFTNTNTAASPTLNVNSTGAKPIVYGTGTITSSNLKYAGTANIVMYYVYDGTSWVWIGQSQDENATGYLPLTGGTVSGKTTIQDELTLYKEGTTTDDLPARLKFSVKDTTTGKTYTSASISAYQDHGASTFGTNMVLQSGGSMILGSGESPTSQYTALKGDTGAYGGEDTWIVADTTINLQAGANNITNRKGARITAAGEIVPIVADVPTNNVQSIGTTDYKWGSMYATTFYGALSGNASTATEFSANKAVTLTGDVTGTASSKGGWSVATTLANSGVTAGSYGPSANATPAVGATFNVPYITVDAKGRLTAASTKTVTIPSDSAKANLASPTFTGTPKAPTATAGTNTTQVATTAFVTTAVANGVASAVSSIPAATTTTPKMDGTAAVGSETKYAKGDHVHPSDTTKANLASPTFTGTPKAPTAASGTNNTQIATTAFVTTAVTNAALPKTTTTPKVNVDSTTGVIGTETKYAAGDHQHPAQTYVDSVRHVGAVKVATAIAANRIGVYDPTAGGYVQLAANVEFSLNWPILYFPTAAAVGSYTNARLTYPAAANSGASSMTVGQQTWLRLLLTSEIDRTVIYVSTVKTVADTKTNPYIYIPLGVASTASAIYFNPAQYGSVLINQPGYIVG